MAYFRNLVVKKIYPKFWVKTFLHLTVPGGFGYIRKLRSLQDAEYVHERDKHEVRVKHHGQGGWKDTAEDGLLKRDYASYDEYLTHQKLKLDEMVKIKGGFSNFDIFDYRVKFLIRFRQLEKLLPKSAKIVCCGARQGTEVDVLRDLGFYNAIGIDLNPGPNNPLVIPGDMMKLDFADNSVDLLYTNCVDHAFDLDQLIAEHSRVIKPDGFLLYDVGVNMEGGGGAFEAISWERTEDVLLRILKSFRAVVRIERESQWLWILAQGKL